MKRTSVTWPSGRLWLQSLVLGQLPTLVLTSGGARSEERIHDLIDALKKDMHERMETVTDRTLDREYLESDEFFDLVMRALDATIRTRDGVKRRLYARILTESTIRSKREGHSPEGISTYLRI